jgi:hypothetical protein
LYNRQQTSTVQTWGQELAIKKLGYMKAEDILEGKGLWNHLVYKPVREGDSKEWLQGNGVAAEELGSMPNPSQMDGNLAVAKIKSTGSSSACGDGHNKAQEPQLQALLTNGQFKVHKREDNAKGFSVPMAIETNFQTAISV